VRAWPTVRLRDVLRVRSEITHPRDLPEGEGRFVGLEHVESNTGRRIGELTIRLEDLTGRKARFHSGDIVYGYLRPYLNKVWLADFDGYCSVDQYVFEVDQHVADSEYVGHFMRSGTFLSRAPTRLSPGQLPRIRIEEILEVSMPSPPIPEQRRIAADLGAQLTEAASLRASSLASREDVRRLTESIRRDFMDGLHSNRVRLGAIVAAAGAIIDGPFGSNLKGDHYKSNGVRVIRLGNIGMGRFIDVDRAFVTRDHANRLQRHRADPGDVVIAALGDGARPAGRACLVPPDLGPSIVKADCFRVRTKGSDLGAAFLMHAINSPQTLAMIQAATRGATRPRMNLAMLKNIALPVPPMNEQLRLAAELDERLAESDALDASVRARHKAIEALPAALLRRAFGDRD
jgi:restriction endonuclease S subunit